MDPSKSVAEDKVNRILEAVRLAPTSLGLQPFEVIVVSNPEMRERIKPIAYGQGQITDGSHLLVFAAWDNYTPERINMVFDHIENERGFSDEALQAYRQRLLDQFTPRPAQMNFEHAARQTFIGLGLAVTAAAMEDVDATPMEGFDPDGLDEILGLRARGLRSVAIMMLGYRDPENDWLVNLKKVRRPRDQFVTELR